MPADEAMKPRRKPNGRELSAIIDLAVLDAQMQDRAEVLRERLGQIPHGWRDWRMIATRVGTLLCQLYDTLPTRTLSHLEVLCRHGEMLVRLRPPCREPEYVLVQEDAMRTLMDAAMGAECAICLRDEREIAACPLRKALERFAPPDEFDPYGCAYRDIALTIAEAQTPKR